MKLLVIGLDGADWGILDPWIAGGDMPHLAALRGRGQWGLLRSTIRPESSVAWATFAAGVNPGRHGIFGFAAQQPHSYTTTLNTAAQVQQPSFWRRAAAAGKRLALLNVPMTYPPQPFDGALVGGMLSPSIHSQFTHPPDLRRQLLAAAPDYTINVDRAGLSLRSFIRQTTHSIAARARAAHWLLQQDAWDAFVVVFSETDRLQHYTLHLLAPDHPRHDPAAAAALLPDLLAAYRALDAAVGDLVAAAGPEAELILLSDHGFAPCARAFLPNVWLEQQGLLRRDAGGGPPTPGLWRRLRGHAGLRRLKNSLPLLRHWRRPPPPGDHLAGVDWAQTQAVYSPAGGIRLNVQGREPQGVLTPAAADRLRGDLIAALTALINPATAAAPLLQVLPREDLYNGPFLSLAPDLILEPRRADPDPRRNTTCSPAFGPHCFGDSGELTGNHTLDGIFLAAGPDIAPGRLTGSHLLDLAPTILHALAAPVPDDLEGQILPLWASRRPILRAGPEEEERLAAASSPFTPAEEAAVADRLRSLGYL